MVGTAVPSGLPRPVVNRSTWAWLASRLVMDALSFPARSSDSGRAYSPHLSHLQGVGHHRVAALLNTSQGFLLQRRDPARLLPGEGFS